MTNIFDTHAHYASRQFDGDRADLLAALPRGGVVGVLECATHSGDAQKVLELAHTAPYFHAALGIHPESLIEEDAATVAVYHGDWRAELAAMRPLYEDPAVVAVGEIGLDHHWPVPREEQYALFEAQLQLARSWTCPCRSTTGKPMPKCMICCANISPAVPCTATVAAPMTPPGWWSRACIWALAVP